jgi:hypothetical protein
MPIETLLTLCGELDGSEAMAAELCVFCNAMAHLRDGSDRRRTRGDQRTSRQAAIFRRLFAKSFSPRLERAAKLVGERSEPLARGNVLALRVLAHFLGLVRVLHGLDAETNAAT